MYQVYLEPYCRFMRRKYYPVPSYGAQPRISGFPSTAVILIFSIFYQVPGSRFSRICQASHINYVYQVYYIVCTYWNITILYTYGACISGRYVLVPDTAAYLVPWCHTTYNIYLFGMCATDVYTW